MKKFWKEIMVATAKDIYVDDVEKIQLKIWEILQIISSYTIASKNFNNRFVVFLLNIISKILNQGY